jgi:predicted transcriptional regulator of viral defense system
MFDERMEALARQQHGLISLSQAGELGGTESAIRHRRRQGRLVEVSQGVFRLPGAGENEATAAMAAVLSGGPDAVLSHGSAAAWLGLPGFTVEPLTVSVRRHGRRRRPDVRYEQSLVLPAHHRRVIDLIPTTSMARTLFDLCGDREVRLGRAARALDTALARRMVTMPALWRVLDDLAERGRRGTVWMRTLLTERGGRYVPPESELEARFLALVTRFGLPPPERQVDLGDADQWIGRVDFVWRNARLIVEVDGAGFHDGLIDRRRDAQRDEQLAAAGWTVLRFRWADITETPQEVVEELRIRCRNPS